LVNLAPEVAMNVYNVHAAKTQLSKLIEQAIAGEEVVIARNNEPVVKLVPIQLRPKPQFGSLKGQIVIHDSFFDPLSDEELEAWGLK
jgi:prevent-host-death family protein